MNNKRFSVFRGLVLVLSILLAAGDEPRPVLSAPRLQNNSYVMGLSVVPEKLCPDERGTIVVNVSPNPEEIDLDHPERNNPPAGVTVVATVARGTLIGPTDSGKTVVAQTDAWGTSYFGYHAPKGQQGEMESLQIQAIWTEPWSGHQIQLEKTNFFFLVQCSYELWIVDHHAISSPWTGAAIGLAKAQVDDAGNLTGDGTMDLFGSVAMGDVTENGHSAHKITVKGNVSGGTANFELDFKTTESVLTITTSNGSTQMAGVWGPELPNGKCHVDAFKGGPVRCFFNTFVDVVRK